MTNLSLKAWSVFDRKGGKVAKMAEDGNLLSFASFATSRFQIVLDNTPNGASPIKVWLTAEIAERRRGKGRNIMDFPTTRGRLKEPA